jgi:hypothetical protein
VSEVAGYTGITAEGAGFTGAAPMAAATGGYEGILESSAHGESVGYTGVTPDGTGYTGVAPVNSLYPGILNYPPVTAYTFEPEVIEGHVRPAPEVVGPDGDISYELRDAWELRPPTTHLLGLSPAELHVLSWLRTYSGEIAAAEEKWRIDRRAIAGAIAWEALMNPRSAPWDGLGRSSGPGKVHYSTEKTWGEGNPIARQVESHGYLPPQSMNARRQLLASRSGAIDYVGAIMAALADVAANHGHNIRTSPEILTNAYQGKDLPGWELHLRSKPQGEDLRAGDPMGLWVESHLPYLEEGVGVPGPIAEPAFVGRSRRGAP